MSELKPCPFCGGKAEMHFGEFIAEYVRNDVVIPKDARIIRKTKTPGLKYWIIEYRRRAYIPRCIDTRCAGRLTKQFKTEQEAIEAWNRRAEDA